MKKLLSFMLCFVWYCTSYGQMFGKLSPVENELLSADSVNILENESDLLRCKIDSLNQVAFVFSKSYCDSMYNELSATRDKLQAFDIWPVIALVCICVSLLGLGGIITYESPSKKKKIILFVVWGIINGIVCYFFFVFYKNYNFYETQYSKQRQSYVVEAGRGAKNPIEFWALKTDNLSKFENYKKMLAKKRRIEDILHRNESIINSIELAKERQARVEAENLERKKFNDWKMHHDVRKRLKIVRLYWDSNPDIPETGNLNGDYKQKRSWLRGNSSGNLVGSYMGRIVDHERHYLHIKLSDGSYLKIDARSNGNGRWLLAEIGDIVEYSKIFSSYQHFTESWNLL